MAKGKKETKDLTVVANSVRELFSKQGVLDQLKNALPVQTVLSPEKLIRVSLTVIRTNPDLLECSQQSLLACLMGCAQLGLMPEPYLGQAYLVPFWNKTTGQREAQLIPGYRGYITLARNSGELDNLSADVVKENDEFSLKKGLHEDLVHVPCYIGEPGQMIGAYTVFRYLSGSSTFDFMSKVEIDKIRKRSKAKESGPWFTDYEEMAKKTVIRRHMKLAPLSIEDNSLARAAQAENLYLEGESQRDFFLPPGVDAPLDVSTESGGPGTEDRADEFNEKVWQNVDELKSKFLELSAESNGISIMEVKAKAMENIKAFLGAFETWKSKQKPEKEDQYPLHAFHTEWKNLQTGNMKTTGYHVYVLGNIEKIKRFCSQNEDIHRQMIGKYRNVYKTDWPLDADFNVISGIEDEEKTGGPGSQDGSESISMTELMQTDDWQELGMLQEKHPDIYKTVMEGRSIAKSIEEVREIISLMDEKVKAAGGDIPW